MATTDASFTNALPQGYRIPMGATPMRWQAVTLPTDPRTYGVRVRPEEDAYYTTAVTATDGGTADLASATVVCLLLPADVETFLPRLDSGRLFIASAATANGIVRLVVDRARQI